MKEIKILQVIGGLNRGGAETMLMNLYRKIDRQKYKFDFLVYVTDDKKADYEDEILQNGDQIIKLDRNRVKNPILFYHDLNHVMKNSGYTCVHAHTLFNSGIVMYASYHNHIPVRITHSHSSGNMKRDTLINRTYFKFAKYLITKYSTNDIACDLKSGKYLFGEGFSGPVLHNGIDLNRFCYEENAEGNKYQYLRDENVLNLAVIGSFYEVKNHIFLLPIAEKLKEKGIKFKLYFAGRGPLQEMLEEKVKELHLENEIIFLGIVDQVEKFLKNIDLILMPSLYEGVPVSLIEAQAAGVPAIISENISRDVDMELGLLNFVTIDSEKQWLEEIFKFYCEKHENLNPKNIYEQLTLKGYNVEKNVDFLCEIYGNSSIY